ncbi:MAG: peptide deformylase [Capsulimonas sp.]|nr:peptide deformylase [Capsulimonas sp.]
MPAFPVILYPDPRLKMACEPVGVVDAAVRRLIHDLLDTMDAGPPRTVGIAAPQIGAMTRVAIVDISRNPKYEGLGQGYLALVNPRIVAHVGEQIGREGCLSLPDYTANIRRWERITVEALDANGEPLRIDSEGFEAIVLQHEIDHLDGILFLDRVANVKTDLFQRRKK